MFDLVRSASRDAVELIHLHGVISRPKTIVLAFEDYRRYPDEHPGLLAKVRQLLLQHPVLFLGFGMTDPNFLQWSGWLQDIIGTHKNPWINITLDPPLSLPHARYWGTRLDSISVRPFGRFAHLVPQVFKILGEALDNESRSVDVARQRIRAAKTVSDVLREVEELLSIGAQRGAEGNDWDWFRINLFNTAASHVLDLAQVPWLDLPPASKASGLTVTVDARAPSLRDEDAKIVDDLIRAFGTNEWRRWCRLIGEKHVGPAWMFERVDPSGARAPDIRNRTKVTIDIPTTAMNAPAAASVDAELDALREGRPINADPANKSAQGLRLSAYLAYQEGQWERAAEQYRRAEATSRTEHEPLRREWFTSRSRLAALDGLLFRVPKSRRSEVQDELSTLRKTLQRLRDSMAHLPYEEREDPILEESLEAETKLAEQLVNDLDDDDDDDTTMRFGQVYGSAERWLDRLERYWFVPAIVAPAAEALGTLQWRYGDRAGAAKILARYGSKRLRVLLRALLRSPSVEPVHVSEMIKEVLSDGRWPGEWLARMEGLAELLPWCTREQIEFASGVIERARAVVVSADGGVVRAGSTEFPWSARATIEQVESLRWQWLEGAAALTAIERWADLIKDIPAHILWKSRALSNLESLPWNAWLESRATTPERVVEVLTRLFNARENAPRGADFINDLEAILDTLVNLSRGPIPARQGTPARTLLSRLSLKFPANVQGRIAAYLAVTDDDAAAIETTVVHVLEGADHNDLPSLREALRIAASAGSCPAAARPVFVGVVHATLDAALARASKDDALGRSAESALEDARIAAHAVMRIQSAGGTPVIAGLREEISRLLQQWPSTAEYLAALGPDALGDAQATSNADVTALLSVRRKLPGLTRREQEFAGLRAVTRVLLQLGPTALDPDWLPIVATLTRVSSADLAAYASWVLSEWARRRVAGEQDSVARSLVEPTLRSLAVDGRVIVRANAERGLIALNSTMPSDRTRAVVEELARDPRVALRRRVA